MADDPITISDEDIERLLERFPDMTAELITTHLNESDNPTGYQSAVQRTYVNELGGELPWFSQQQESTEDVVSPAAQNHTGNSGRVKYAAAGAIGGAALLGLGIILGSECNDPGDTYNKNSSVEVHIGSDIEVGPIDVQIGPNEVQVGPNDVDINPAPSLEELATPTPEAIGTPEATATPAPESITPQPSGTPEATATPDSTPEALLPPEQLPLNYSLVPSRFNEHNIARIYELLTAVSPEFKAQYATLGELVNNIDRFGQIDVNGIRGQIEIYQNGQKADITIPDDNGVRGFLDLFVDPDYVVEYFDRTQMRAILANDNAANLIGQALVGAKVSNRHGEETSFGSAAEAVTYLRDLNDEFGIQGGYLGLDGELRFEVKGSQTGEPYVGTIGYGFSGQDDFANAVGSAMAILGQSQ